MTRPKSDFENQTHVPRTDVVATAIQSPAWASAVSRMLVNGNADRRLDACLSVPDLRSLLGTELRQVVIVEVGDHNFEACCELSVVNIGAASPSLLIGLADGMGGDFRHTLLASGFAVTFESFASLSRLVKVVDKFFSSLPLLKLSIEESAEFALPWGE
jgi:hypothetical protein